MGTRKRKQANGRRWWLLPVIVIVLGGGQSSCSTSSPDARGPKEDQSERETWDVVFLNGERAGHIHTTVFRESRPTGNVFRIEQEEALTLRRGDNRIDTRSTITSLETPDGRLLEFTCVLAQGDAPMETKGRVIANELQLEVGSAGRKSKVSLPWAEEFGGPYRVPVALQSQPLAPGETRIFRYLDAGTNQLATRTLTAADFEETQLTRQSRRLLRVESQTSIAGSTINSTLWLDQNGEIYKEQIAEMFNYTAVRATKQEAMKRVTQIDFDLGKLSAVPVERSLSTPHNTRRIVYRVHLESSDPARVFVSCRTQQVVSEDEHTALVTVYAIRPGDSAGNPQAQPDGATDGDLEPNHLIQSDDAEIANLSRRIAGETNDPWQTATALEKWVNANMASQGISSAFATAAEVVRDRKGDCTEHAVLLAALARAHDIPARVAIGLVYYRQEFLYHMWNEVYVDGIWIPLDATLAQGGIGAAHLKITDSNLQGASPHAAFLPVTEVIGQLKIEMVEVE